MPFVYRRSGPRIVKVNADFPVVVPIEPISFPKMVEEMGDCLQLDYVKGRRIDRLWVLEQDWASEVVTDEMVIRRKAKRGYVTDWGSIPAIVESVQKRDDRDCLIGFLNHDIDFGTNGLTFETSNCQLYQTIDYAGHLPGGNYSAFKAWRIWYAVSSRTGARAYDTSPEQIAYEKKWASVRMDAK